MDMYQLIQMSVKKYGNFISKKKREKTEKKRKTKIEKKLVLE